MNPIGKAGKRLRLALVAATLLLAAGAGYDIKISPPMYLESATVELALPKTQNAPNAYYMFAPSLIASGEVMVQILMSPSAQHQIDAAGRAARVSLALVNLYNEEYPYYGVPLATLTAASPVAADAHRTFLVAAHVLVLLLAARQKQMGVPPARAHLGPDPGGQRAHHSGRLARTRLRRPGLPGGDSGRPGLERRRAMGRGSQAEASSYVM